MDTGEQEIKINLGVVDRKRLMEIMGRGIELAEVLRRGILQYETELRLKSVGLSTVQKDMIRRRGRNERTNYTRGSSLAT